MTQDAIRTRIEQFTRELEALVREAAIEAVTGALGGAAVARPRSAAIAKPVAKAAAAAVAPVTSAKLSFKRKKGSKRSPEQLAAIDAAILAYVKTNPGQGNEHMGKALGVPTNDLKLRVLGLVGNKKLKKTGLKRATKYFPV
jgi:hypothetical protein